jgi:hypothetical protein
MILDAEKEEQIVIVNTLNDLFILSDETKLEIYKKIILLDVTELESIRKIILSYMKDKQVNTKKLLSKITKKKLEIQELIDRENDIQNDNTPFILNNL